MPKILHGNLRKTKHTFESTPGERLQSCTAEPGRHAALELGVSCKLPSWLPRGSVHTCRDPRTSSHSPASRQPCDVGTRWEPEFWGSLALDAVLGHQLLSEVLWHFVQKKKPKKRILVPGWISSKRIFCQLTPHCFSCTLSSFLSPGSYALPNKRSNFHPTSTLLVSVHYRPELVVIKCFAFIVRSQWCNVPAGRHVVTPAQRASGLLLPPASQERVS